ncbi:hypothetical protein K402DRAFT_397946 [Aulographum hederae CBS 113979]|uniref:Thioesterase/thiol ester dehydrase-isomerase n=1 Tax=Aulographum hederae CBS 113979 TaxID=1176131 RepID=A0A6G1GM93_9PEZI|nr:hypothetical protein K402DRAFT_397946 [Aulographum hederae CBS 113979]
MPPRLSTHLRQHFPRVAHPAVTPPIANSRTFVQTPPTPHSSSAEPNPVTASLNPRWLSELKSRIGKCIMFGLQPAQAVEAAHICREMAQDWRALLAGSEGFLTDKWRCGLYGQEVVWGEMDSMGHVNNVTYNRYAESARVNWTQNFAKTIDPSHKKEWSELLTSRSNGLILRSIKTDFKFPMTWPDRITVLHKLRSEPTQDTDSFFLDVLILSERHRRTAARCVEDIVVYDYRKGKKTPLLPFMVDKFRETFQLQQEAKKKYGGRVNELMARVRELEKASWDRVDAKEDLGSASP